MFLIGRNTPRHPLKTQEFGGASVLHLTFPLKHNRPIQDGWDSSPHTLQTVFCPTIDNPYNAPLPLRLPKPFFIGMILDKFDKTKHELSPTPQIVKRCSPRPTLNIVDKRAKRGIEATPTTLTGSVNRHPQIRRIKAGHVLPSVCGVLGQPHQHTLSGIGSRHSCSSLHDHRVYFSPPSWKW